MSNEYDGFFEYNDKKHEEETKKRKERGAGPSNVHKDKLITKKGYDYSLILVPYVHGPKGLPPIIEIAMHFRVGGKSFPCLYQNGIEETCAADEFVQKLWDKWNEYNQAYGKKSDQCKQVVSIIQNVQANARWYSPVLVVDVRDSEGDVVTSELERWRGRVVWWDYPETIYKQIDKEYKMKGTLWHPEDPALFIVSKEDATNAKTKKSYIKPTLMIDFPRDKGKYKIVKNKSQIKKLLDSVPNIYDSGILTVLSNDEIRSILDSTYNKQGEEKAAGFNPEFKPEDLESKSDDSSPFLPDTRPNTESPDVGEEEEDGDERTEATEEQAIFASEVTDLFEGQDEE